MDRLEIAHIKASQSTLTLDTSTWSEVLVGSERLSSRKWVQIYNRSQYKVFWSYDNTASVQNAFALKTGGMLILPLSESVPVYFKGSASTQKIIIAEVS